MKSCISCAFSVLLICAATARATNVSGTLTTQTWTTAGNPYRVTGLIAVPAGETLTIEPGVDVLFDADVLFIVQGTVRASGTVADSVRFLPGGASEWGGIRIITGTGNIVEYARISGAHADGAALASYGGGIYLEGGDLVLSNAVVSGNVAEIDGGGIFTNSAFLTLSACRIAGNRAQNGGGLFNRLTAIVAAETWIESNSATANGGGVAVSGQSGSLFMTDGTIRLNSAAQGGGGWFEGTVVGSFYRALVVENTATGYGGGMVVSGSGSAITLLNCTASNNAADSDAGIRSENGAIANIQNTISWGNKNQQGAAMAGVTLGGTIPGLVFSSYSTFDGAIAWPDVFGVHSDPKFVDYANGDFNLQAGSPCIDTGSPDTGFDPDDTRTDIGALFFDQSPTAVRADVAPLRFTLAQNAPNPFNPATTIRFSLSAAGPVRLTIHDATGRLVRTLIAAPLTAGAHEVAWDGADETGRAVASGIYLYRLVAADGVDVRRMALVR